MANYNRSEAYDLSVFDLPDIKSSVAPRIDDVPENIPAKQKRPSRLSRYARNP